MQLLITLTKVKKMTAILFLFFSSLCLPIEVQNKDLNVDENLQNTVYEILEAYGSKNENAFNKFINSKIGLSLIFTWETTSAVSHVKNICFSKDCRLIGNSPIPYNVSDQIKNQKIRYKAKIKVEALPKFIKPSCEKVDKVGVFMDNSTVNIKVDIPSKDISKINKLNTKKIIVSDNTQGFYTGNFVFYVSKVKSKWWITAIDFATLELDCHF